MKLLPASDKIEWLANSISRHLLAITGKVAYVRTAVAQIMPETDGLGASPAAHVWHWLVTQ